MILLQSELDSRLGLVIFYNPSVVQKAMEEDGNFANI